MLVRHLPPGVCRTQPQDGDITNVLFLAEGGVLLFVDWHVCFCMFVAGLLVVLLAVDRLGRKKSMALCFFIFSLFILPLYACIDRWVWLLRRHFVTFKQQSATCLSLRPRRIALTIIIFIARAFISAGFQVAFVYTPEVCQYFNHLKIIISLFLDRLNLTKHPCLLPDRFFPQKTEPWRWELAVRWPG